MGAAYIGWRYLAFHRVKSLLLVACLTLVLFLPIALRILVERTEQQLTKRATATPLLVGAKGSPLELTLNSLYFETQMPAPLPFGEVASVRDSGLAQAIPLYVRFVSRGRPIVGTSLDYFGFRGLKIARGRQMQRLGDCVIGAAVAKQLDLGPGDSVMSSPESVLDIAGTYPLKLRVAGVLGFANSPDDSAIFTDIKTTWIIEGLAHGHTDLTAPAAKSGVLKRDGDRITANASVVQYNEITDENVDSFHFHGDVSGFSMTAILVVPPDQKSAALLRGHYESRNHALQMLVPGDVVDELLATILTVKHYVTLGMTVLGGATLITASLVFLLSLRLRRREIETLHKIGGDRTAVFIICAFEVIIVLAVSASLSGLLAGVTHWAGPNIIQIFL